MRKLLILSLLSLPLVLHGETPKLPPDKEIKALVSDSLLAFNKAVQEKSFAQFYEERLSSQVHQQISLDKFTALFQTFLDKGYDISNIAKSDPVFDIPPAIDSDGLLVLKGRYETRPNKVAFELRYLYESSGWKLLGVNVQVVPVTLSQKDENEAANHINTGISLAQEHQYDSAIREFTRAAELTPKNANCYINRAIAYSESGRYDLAISDFTKAIELAKDEPRAYVGRADQKLLQKQYKSAIADYDQAIQLKRDDPYPFQKRAYTYKLAGDYEKSIADYQEALRLRPNDPNLIAGLQDAGQKLVTPGSNPPQQSNWQNWYNLTQNPQSNPYTRTLIEQAAATERSANEGFNNFVGGTALFLILLIGGGALLIGFMIRRSRPPVPLSAAPKPENDANRSTSVADEIRKLDALRSEGIISEEEFQKQKNRCLSSAPS